MVDIDRVLNQEFSEFEIEGDMVSIRIFTDSLTSESEAPVVTLTIRGTECPEDLSALRDDIKYFGAWIVEVGSGAIVIEKEEPGEFVTISGEFDWSEGPFTRADFVDYIERLQAALENEQDTWLGMSRRISEAERFIDRTVTRCERLSAERPDRAQELAKRISDLTGVRRALSGD